MIKAILLERRNGSVSAGLRELAEDDLPRYPENGEVTVAIDHSSLNYKDGMILNGLGRLVRHYPHVPGVDFAGRVETSAHPDYKPGDAVVLTGWRVGERHWGGYAQKARVKGDWLVPLPEGLSPRHAMTIGTAGLAAMLAVIALEAHDLGPESGEVLVTGASGGVGSIAVALLAARGYQVVASSGRAEAGDFLGRLGATTVIDRSPFADPAERPLESERWAACIDNVGGNTLARVLAQTRYLGSVAAVGLAGGNKLETTVLPFLLRGVKLLGIDTVMCSRERRLEAWARLASDLTPETLESITVDAGLGDLPKLGKEILEGRVRGRVVVDVNK